jgi:nicotinamidase-related amidase
MSYERLTPQNAALLLVDHQGGLSNGVQDQSLPEYITNVTALVKLAKA